MLNTTKNIHNKFSVPQKGYKNTDFGWIPTDWEVDIISNLANISTGKKDTQDKVSNGQYPFFVRSQTVESINSYSYDGIAVLTAGDGVGVGKVFHYINGKFNYHQRVYKISDFKDNIDPLYFFEYFKNNFLKEVTKYNAKTSVDSVRLEMISEMRILLPPPAEQKAIAALLSTWDKAIANYQLLIENCQLRKKWLMQQLLTGKKRLPGFNGKWKEVSLEDIFDRVTRKNERNNNNIVTISAQKGFVRQEDFFNKIVASATLDNYLLIEKGEFCYNKSYCNGYPWGATKRLKIFEKAVVTTLYICFRLKDPMLHSGDFYEHFFEFNSLDKGLSKIAHEGGRAHGLLNVTPSDFFSLKIKIPSIDEQTAIANILRKADEEIFIKKQKLEELKKQKKGLIQILLTGEKRIKL